MSDAHWRLHVSDVYLNFLCYHIREITSYSSVFFHAWCLDICTVQITSLSKGGNVQYTHHAFCLHENVYTKNYMLKTACYKCMLKIRRCGCYMFFNQAGKSKSLRQRWHGLTFFNPDLPRLGTSSSLTVTGPVSNFKTETQSARRPNVFCPTIPLTIFHWWPRAFCSVKSLQWNVNLKI